MVMKYFSTKSQAENFASEMRGKGYYVGDPYKTQSGWAVSYMTKFQSFRVVKRRK